MNQKSKILRLLPAALVVVILVAIALGAWLIKARPAAVEHIADGSAATATSKPQQQQEESDPSLFLPNEDAVLEKTPIDKKDLPSSKFKDQAKSAIELIQRQSPNDLPPGTKLLDVQTNNNGTATLNFNSAFANDDFWYGSARTITTLYSIVNTVASLQADDFKASQIQFLVEGKTVEVLGEFDVHDPLKPDMQWVKQN